MCSANSNTSTSIRNNNITSSTSSFAAKLRRLKIEESILLQNINKTAIMSVQSNIELNQTNYVASLELKKFFTKTRNTYNELKQLFQDIKASTSSKEMIKSLDIDDVKKCTLELENNIKSFKLYLHNEINTLKSAERQLNQKLNDPISTSYLKRKPRVQTAKYTEIVPSPVKTLMTSPFKCSEVQDLQDFMKNSINRYGGWDEYHHNIFVNLWQKYFDTENSIDAKNVFEATKTYPEFRLFLRELMPKLIGISEDDVLSHVQWYTKYLHLKDRQQKAIEKWRLVKRMMIPSNVKGQEERDRPDKKKNCVKKSKRHNRNVLNLNNVTDYMNPEEVQIKPNDQTGRFTRKCYSNSFDESDENDKETLHFLKSTKQWNIRCSSKKSTNEMIVNNIETIKKLAIPSWRIDLGNI